MEYVEWRAVPGRDGYEVSDRGGIRSWVGHMGRGRREEPRYLRPSPNKDGYLFVDIKGKPSYIHIMVAEAFIGPRPAGLDVCHNNGRNQDNWPDNLRYDTRLGNQHDRMRHGTDNSGRRNPNSWASRRARASQNRGE